MPVLLDHRDEAVDLSGPIEENPDGMPVPHIFTFQSVLRGAWKTYMHERWDEAMRMGRDVAASMERQGHLLGMMQERILASAGLKWHLEVPDDYDQLQLMVKDHLTVQIQRIPYFIMMRWYLLWATWYGRYGSQIKWGWDMIPNKVMGQPIRSLLVKHHLPIHGDKIGHTWGHDPYVLISSAYGEEVLPPDVEVIYTNAGAKAAVLRGRFRESFVIHRHQMIDADFWDPEGAEAIHGAGIRHFLMWTEFTRQEYLTWVADYMERVGLGVTIFLYDASNPEARQEAERQAKEQSRRSVIVWPAFKDSGVNGGVQRIETPVVGAEFLLNMVRYLEEQEERYIIGQTLSSDSEGSGLGGTGVAWLHANTKQRIILMDSLCQDETITNDLVAPMKRATFPWADFPVKFVSEVQQADPEKTLSAVMQAYNMGVPFITDEVRGLTGMTAPAPDDDVVMVQFGQQMPGATNQDFGHVQEGDEEEDQEDFGEGDETFDKAAQPMRGKVGSNAGT